MADLKEIQINGVVYNFKDTTARTQVGTGTPTIVSLVADMVDTTKPYLYVGSETGYTAGDWYYYDGSAWVSGGTYGTDGGINTNARNILKYILQRVAYTETGMQTYVDALYQALAQAGGGGSETTTYMIMNALTHVTNSNTATGCDEGDSYTATLTADEEYSINSVTVTMGGTDITSTAYDSATNTITIASVTGDVVITATARSSLLYSWDLTQSLTDTESGLVATTTATQGDTGLVFSTASKYCDFGAIYQTGRTYELDVAEIGTGTGNYRRMVMADTDANTGSGGSGLIYAGSWKIYTGSSWGTITDSQLGAYNSMNGKTLRIYVDENRIWHFYTKTTGSDEAFSPAGVGASAMKEYTNGHVYIGGNKDDYIANARFTGFRVYEGERA